MAWNARRAALRNACDAEVQAKLKKIDAAPRSPHLPDLPAGPALGCLVPWRKGAAPPARRIAELHLPKRSGDGGNSLRCWRIASWATHETAIAASRLSLAAPDPRAAMARDLGVMLWSLRRRVSLSPICGRFPLPPGRP